MSIPKLSLLKFEKNLYSVLPSVFMSCGEFLTYLPRIQNSELLN